VKHNKLHHVILHLDTGVYSRNATVFDSPGSELNQIILMTDYGSGISEQPNQHLRCGVTRLVCWLVQLSNHMLSWGKSQEFLCCTSMDLLGKMYW